MCTHPIKEGATSVHVLLLMYSHNYLLYMLSDPNSTLVTHFKRCHPSSCPPSHSTAFSCKQCPITWQDCSLLVCIQQRQSTLLTFTQDKMWPRLERLFLHWWGLLQDKRYATNHIPPSLRNQTTKSVRPFNHPLKRIPTLNILYELDLPKRQNQHIY